jgi:hypothetical protein
VPELGHSFAVGALPAGKYLATYAVGLTGSSATQEDPEVNGWCALNQTSSDGDPTGRTAFTTAASVYDTSEDSALDLALSGAAVVDAARGQLRLECAATREWTTGPSGPTFSFNAEVTITRLDTPTTITGTS